jgi:hypothetical protein
VQGLDYVHTVQGWLKGMNHPSLDPTVDPGEDGDANNVGRDAWGMVLGYFSGEEPMDKQALCMGRVGIPSTARLPMTVMVQNISSASFMRQCADIQ